MAEPTAEDPGRSQGSELDLRIMFESNPHPMWIYDLKTLAFLAVNDAAIAHYGYSREEFLQMTIADIRPAEDVPALLDNIARGGQGLQDAGTWRHKKKDGAILYVEITSHTLQFGGRDAKLILASDITTRKRSEDALRESEERLRLALAAANQGLFDANLLTGEIVVSPEYATMLGYDPENYEISIARWKDQLHPEDRERASDAFRAYLDGEAPHYAQEYRMRAGTDDWKWILSMGRIVARDAEGKPVRMLGTHADITERKRAEEQTDDALRYLRTMMRSSPIGIVAIRASGRVVAANDAVAQMMGGTVGQLLAQNVRELAAWQKYGLLTAAEEALAKNCERQFDTHYVSTFGKTLWLTIRFVPFEHENEPHLLALIVDRSERKQAEEMLQASEARLRAIIDRAPFGAHSYELQPDGRLILVAANRSADQILGIDHSSLVGNTIEEAFPGLEGTPIPDSYRHVASAGEGFDTDRVDYDRGLVRGAFAIHAFQTGSNRMSVFFRDITERKKAEEEKAKLQAQLLQAQRMESIGRLAGGVAHDFNNMLCVILGYTELIRARLMLGDPLLEDMLEIERAADRAKDITQQLLTFSRKQIITPKPVALNNLILGAKNTLGRLIGEDIEFRFHPGDDLWQIRFDPSQAEQILINLAVNARDAMPGGGILTIRTENVRLEESHCLVRPELKPGIYVLFEVSDNGAGMDKETRAHVFEPFFTTKEPGKGTGLGLATVYGIVTQNGGLIDVESEPGRGTIFRIYIPMIMEEDLEEESAEEAPVDSGAGTVLLVEDDRQVRGLTKRMLEAIGYNVLVAETPSDALALCAREGSSIDLVLTDVVMPGMSGAELKNRLSAMRPGTRVLFMSGYTYDAIAHRGALEEGMHLIRKPFSKHALAEKVRQVIRQG